MKPHAWTRLVFPPAAALCLLAGGCGGGGGGSDGGPPPTVRIAGSVYAGPVEGASVVLRDAAGAAVAGPVATEADGSYEVDVPSASLAGDLTAEASGGGLTDEATGDPVSGCRLRAWVPAHTLSAGEEVHLTPASTVLADLVTLHGRTPTQAAAAVGAAFAFAPDLGVRPANAPGADVASRLAALRAAAFSQLTEDLGLPPSGQFDLLEALADDLADGTLDAAAGGATVAVRGAPLPGDVQNRFAAALVAFRGSSGDHTGLGAGEIGFLPFAKVALTRTYRVEYVPLPPGAALGETPFRLRITRRETETPAPGLEVTLWPAMHMGSYEHGAPVGAAMDRGDGTYDCSAYYTMAGGDPYGYWTLSVEIDGEVATFHPSVGSPSYATLWGQADRVPGGARRAFYLFDAGLSEEDPARGTYEFSLFVAAREDDWKFPALGVGTLLHGEPGEAWTVETVVVEVSLDGASWAPAVPGAPGRWSVSGLTGIDPSSEELTFYVRLMVNGEAKTAGDGTGWARLASGGASCCN